MHSMARGTHGTRGSVVARTWISESFPSLFHIPECFSLYAVSACIIRAQISHREQGIVSALSWHCTRHDLNPTSFLCLCLFPRVLVFLPPSLHTIGPLGASPVTSRCRARSGTTSGRSLPDPSERMDVWLVGQAGILLARCFFLSDISAAPDQMMLPVCMYVWMLGTLRKLSREPTNPGIVCCLSITMTIDRLEQKTRIRERRDVLPQRQKRSRIRQAIGNQATRRTHPLKLSNLAPALLPKRQAR